MPVEGFAQQFSAVQQQTKAIQHILSRRDAPSTAAPGARPQSARRRGRPPVSSRAAPPQAESTPRPARRASRRSAVPPASQPGPKSSRKSTKRPWRGQPGDVGVCSFPGDGENSAAPSPGGGPWGESSVSFCFCSTAGPRASGTHFLKERAISFSSGFSGPWDDSVRRPASSLSPTTHFASSQESTVQGWYSSPRTSGQSSLGPRKFGEDASERNAFCTIHPYSLSLHLHSYVDCAVGAACTVSGGVAHASQPVSLAHAHNRLGHAIQFESWTGLYTSSHSRCWCTGAWSNAFNPIGLQRSTRRMLIFTLQSFHDTERSYGLRSKVWHGSTGSSPSGSPCLPVCSRRA